MINFIFLLIFSFYSMAGLPPTASKGNGETDYVTTFRTNYGTWPVTRTGSLLNLGTLPITMGGTGNTSGTTTINANLTGPITSVGNATSIAAQVGTGTTFVMSASPTITTPSFSGTATGSISGNAGTATNISGGAGGSIPYQTAASTTALLANGTAGQTLTSQGTTLAPIWTTGVPGTEWATNGTHIYNNNAGNVGIGTTAPLFNLDISGTTSNRGLNMFPTLGTGANSINMNSSGAGTYLGHESSAGGTITGGVGANESFVGSSGAKSFHLLTNAASRMTIDSSGNVGVGTTAPATNLEINSANDTRARLFSTGGAYSSTLELTALTAGTYGSTLQYSSNSEDLQFNNYGRTLSPADSTSGGFSFITKVANTTPTKVMFIHGYTGNVGIGTTSPLAKLDVVGGIIANNTTVGPAVIARTSGNGHLGVSVNNTTFGSTETTAFGLFQDTSGVAALYNNNISSIAIGTTGKVGIGTTAPDDSLSISSSLANTADWYNSGNQQLHITNTNGAGYTAIRTDGNPVTTWVYGVNGASDGLRINPRNNTSGAASFYMDQNGHVGIGTTAPLFNLDISGTTSNRGLNMFPTLGTGANSINMNSSGAGTYLGHESSAGGTITGGVGANESFVGSSGAKSFHLLTNAASRMTIDSSGNVGVGTTAPATNLEINSANDTRARLFSTGGAYSSTLELTALTAGTYGSTLQYSSNSEDLQFNNYGRTLSPADSTSGGFSFITKVANTTPTKVMFIHGYTGNVGIGTVSPAQALDVAGSIVETRSGATWGAVTVKGQATPVLFGATASNGAGSPCSTGTCTLDTAIGTNLTSIVWTSAGQYTINYTGMTIVPVCLMSPIANGGTCYPSIGASTTSTNLFCLSDVGTPTNSILSVQCIGY
jgi:hypothetical protein